MQSTISKILIALILGLLVIAGGLAIWFFVFMPKASSPSQPGQTTQNNNGGIDNSSTVTVPNDTTAQPSSTAQQPPADINAAYAALFPQILGTEAQFVDATATSTGDLGKLYALYAADVAADKKAYPQNPPFPIEVALVDLTDDGTPEAIVYENLPSFCGTGGCTLDIYKKTGSTWAKVFSTSGGGVVGLSNTLTNGYLDLYLTVGQGDTVDRYTWNGSTYQFKETMAIWNGSTFTPTQ